MACDGWEGSGSGPVGGLRPDRQGSGGPGPLSPGCREQAGLLCLQEEGLSPAAGCPVLCLETRRAQSGRCRFTVRNWAVSWVGRDRALSPPERAKPGSPLPPGGEGACRPWQAACMAQTSSPGPPPALGPENGPFVGSGLDGQLTWQGRQLPARSRWPGPHGERCGGSGWSGPGLGSLCGTRVCCTLGSGVLSAGRLGRGQPVWLSPPALQACCPRGWPSGGSWRQGCVSCHSAGHLAPCLPHTPLLPGMLRWRPATPLPCLAPGAAGSPGSRLLGQVWGHGAPLPWARGLAALKSTLAACRGPRTGSRWAGPLLSLNRELPGAQRGGTCLPDPPPRCPVPSRNRGASHA